MDDEAPEVLEGDQVTDLVLNTSPDQLLQSLVALVNEGRVPALPINLWTGGQVISGELVSAARYLDETARLLEQVDSVDEIGGIARVHRELALAAQVWSSGDELPLYIHLLNVTSRHATGGPTTTCWRGRLSRVDGWSLALPE